MVLDLHDFIAARGGDPEKIRESQRRRNAPVSVVDDIILMFEAHTKGKNREGLVITGTMSVDFTSSKICSRTNCH